MLLTRETNGSIVEKDTANGCSTPKRGSLAPGNSPRGVHSLERALKPTPKPFFIMDWLEEVDPKHLALAQRMLKAPHGDRIESVRKDLFGAGKASNSNGSPINSSFRERSISIGNGWNAKGLAKAKSGDWEAALACWENALDVRAQVLGENHVDVANTCNNIGIALGKLNRVEEAISYLHRALDIRTVEFGREHAEVAATLHNIGNVRQQGGELHAALECFCESRSLQKKILGPHHVQVARACLALGHTYYQAKEYRDALEAYHDALAIFETAGLPKNDPEVQSTRADVMDLEARIRWG